MLPGPLGEVSAASTAGGGTALTSTAVRIVLPLGTKHITLLPRNFATAVVVQWLKNPWLTILKTQDLLVTEPTDYSEAAQDSSTSTSVVLSSQGTAAQGDYLYVGAEIPFSGVAVDIDAANSNASVLTVNYRKNDGTWATTSASDGTDSGGASMAVDGNVTWTVPTDWDTTSLRLAGDTKLNILAHPLFWTRWQFSAALDSSTTADHMLSINRSTTYHELLSGVGWEEAVTVGPGGISSIQAKTDAGTASLIIDVTSRGNGRLRS